MGAHVSADAGETRAVLDAVRRIVHALHESSRWAEKQVGLSGAQLFVLHALAEAPRLSMTELASRTHTHQSSVSTVVSRLVARGLVVRGRLPVDARRVVLGLSARGRRVAEASPDPVQRRLIFGIDRLPARDRHLLARSLDQLTHAMDVPRGEPTMFFDESKRRRRSPAA